MDEVTVDVDQVRAVVVLTDNVLVPDFVIEGFGASRSAHADRSCAES